MNPNQPLANDPTLMYEHTDTQYTDMAAITPTAHRFEKIVGNELRCTLHAAGCPVIYVKPTQVLERNANGELELIDKG